MTSNSDNEKGMDGNEKLLMKTDMLNSLLFTNQEPNGCASRGENHHFGYLTIYAREDWSVVCLIGEKG